MTPDTFDEQAAAHAKIIEDALLLAWDNMAFVKRRETELYPALQWVRRLVTDDQRASVSGCIRCGAPYDATGSCSRRQQGCQGGRGEASVSGERGDEYSDDRLSLAQEIAETLATRGHWVPKDYAGPDLIMAVGKALDPPTTPNAGRDATEVSDPDALIANARLFIETARTEPEKVVAGMVEDLLSVIYEARTELEKWDLFAGDLRKKVDENRVKLRAVEAALKGGG